MDEKLARTIANVRTLADLWTLEANIGRQNAHTAEVSDALKKRAIELCRVDFAQRTGVDLANLSPAQEKIVEAISEYSALKRREGSHASRTMTQIKNHGLIRAAEESVSRGTTTQGFDALRDAHLEELSYEQIIVDHPGEFSPRAIWYARRTLGLPNVSPRPPAKGEDLTQTRTETILNWLKDASEKNHGRLPSFNNRDTAARLGLEDLHRFGRVIGNIQSRIDFACYRAGLPPLGMGAETPFEEAWSQEDRDWAFPKAEMQTAARGYRWLDKDFEHVLRETRELPGQAHLPWRQEITESESRVKDWAFSLKDLPWSDDEPSDERSTSSRRNPDWSRDELIMALDLYLRFRLSPPAKTSPELADLSAFLGRMRLPEQEIGSTYRNANGVYMKMMNFRSLDPEYTANEKVGLNRIGKLDEQIWAEFANDPMKLAEAVAAIQLKVGVAGRDSPEQTIAMTSSHSETPYWVFVCNPKKWAIDRFLDRRVESDSWGVRPADRQRFAPGQLGIVRVGVDRRTIAERNGGAALEAGIYALCEVESEAFDGTGASDEFWAPGEAREPGWPTVKLRYLRTYLDAPLTIEKLRGEAPGISPLVFNGFQAASFPISAADFHVITAMLGVELDELFPSTEVDVTSLEKLTALEAKYLRAAPEVKERMAWGIERGPIGALVKKHTGFKCQICEALGQNPFGFRKKSGEFYVEAHHVMPVAKREIGSLWASNVMTLCANHHRQMHYGDIVVAIHEASFEFVIEGHPVKLPRFAIDARAEPPRGIVAE